MKPGILCLLTGTIALAGCASTASGGGTPTVSPKATAAVSAATTPGAKPSGTSDPRPASTGVATVAELPTAQPIPTAHLGPAPRATDAFATGKAALKARKYAEAERDFGIAVAHSENTEAASVLLAISATDAGDYATAYKGYTRASLLSPKNAALVYGAAYSALNSQNYHAAVDYAKQYTAMRPKDVRGYHVKFLAEGHLLQAKQQLKDAHTIVALQPNNAESYNDLGIALGNRQHYGASSVAFTKAIHMRSRYAPYYINRAIIENLNGKPKLALADLETAERYSTDPTMRRNVNLAISNLKRRMHH